MSVQTQSACLYVCMCVYVREQARVGEQVCEYVYLHTCVYPGMTNKISSLDIH